MSCKNRFKIISTVRRSTDLDLEKIFSQVGSVQCLPESRELVLNEIKNADAYLASASIVVDDEFLRCAPKLQLIGSPSTGTDHMDISLIKKRGITVFDISQERELLDQFTATSELTFSLALSLFRNVIPAYNSALSGKWEREKFYGSQLFGKTLGIIGLGRLGTISARIGNGFGMNVIGYDPCVKKHETAKAVSFNQLLGESDMISLHVHLDKNTEKMIGMDQFKLMKSNCVLINTSRGKILDENALVHALNNKMIAGAGLDVIDGEWLSDNDRLNHPLIKHANNNQNLLIVPHIGGSTNESIFGARIFMAEKMAKFLEARMQSEIFEE